MSEKIKRFFSAENSTDKKHYIRSFDGLRSIAVIGVIMYHLLPSRFEGGYLGVPILFVLSGYLLTSSLDREFIEQGDISVGKRLKARFMRLYPAMIAMLLITVSYAVIFQPNVLSNVREIVTSSLLGFNNIWQMNNGLSYFEKFINQSPFTHLWSLSLELQFYLAYVIGYALIRHYVDNKKLRFATLLYLALTSAVLMFILYVPGEDPTRVYYGSDTRMFSLLIGSLVALIIPMSYNEASSKKSNYIVSAVGAGMLGILVYGLLKISDHSDGLYLGGMFAYSVVAGILVGILSIPDTYISKVLSNTVFDWIGKRSYGIYLYQYPVMILYEARVANINQNLLLHTIIELILILIISELSYRYIELPFREISLKERTERYRGFIKKPYFTYKIFTTFALVCCFVLTTVTVVRNPKVSNADSFQAHMLEAQEVRDENSNKEELPVEEEPVVDTSYDENLPIPGDEYFDSLPPIELDLTQQQYQEAYLLPITCLGDSIILDASIYVTTLFPQMSVDAEIGRSLRKGMPIIEEMVQNGSMNHTVIISLGSNALIKEEEIDEVMSLLEGYDVYWLNFHVPTMRWEPDANALLDVMDQRYDNLTVINWSGYLSGHPEWLWDDGIHPNIEGQYYLTKLIGQTILKQK